jgi:hypothetical protein
LEIKRNTPSLLGFLVVMVIIVGVIYYLVLAMNTGDARWFLPGFEEQADEMTIHCFGEDVVISATDPAYARMNELINATLTGSKRWDPLTMSDLTYADYQDHPDMLVLEIRYAPPVRVHSNVRYFSNIDTLVIPLVGRHAQFNTIFGRTQGNTTAGSLHVENVSNLSDYLTSQGLCVIPESQ